MISPAEMFCRHPVYLIPAVLLVLILLAGHWRLRRQPLRQRAAWLYLPMLAGACLWAGVATPAIRVSGLKTPKVIVLVETSASAQAAPWLKSQWLTHTLRQVLPGNRRVWIATFNRHVHPAAKPVPLRHLHFKLPVASTSAQSKVYVPANIDAALAWTPAGFKHAQRWVFTSGVVQWPKSLDAANNLSAVTIAPPKQADAGIVSMHAIAGLSANVSPTVRLDALIRATGPMRVTARLFRNGELVDQQNIAFAAAGSKLLSFAAGAGSLLRLQQYHLLLKTDDPWPGDDTADIAVPPAQRTAIAVVTQASRSALPDVLQHAACLSPRQLAMSRLDERYGIFVLYNLPRSAFPSDAARRLADAVGNGGDGLMIIGSSEAFGPGGYADPDSGLTPKGVWPLEHMSPLASKPPSPEPLAITFLLDASGSMGRTVAASGGASRLRLALNGIAAAARLLPARSYLRVLTFSGKTQLVFHGHSSKLDAEISSITSRLQASGPTNPDSALPLLGRVLPHRGILLLLTDGRIPSIKVTGWVRLLSARHSRFAVIAPSRISTAMQRLVLAAHAVHLAAAGPTAWNLLLRRAILQQLVGRASNAAMSWTSTALKLHGTTNQWIETWPKAHAEILASGEFASQPPLAAIRQFGMGKVAAICYRDNSTAFASLLSRMLKRVAPSVPDRRFSYTTRRENSRWVLRVTAVANGRFLNDRRLVLRLADEAQSGGQRDFYFSQVAPGEYACSLPRAIDHFSGSIIVHSADRPRVVALVAPARLPAEYWPAMSYSPLPPWVGGRQIHLSSITAKSARLALADEIMHWKFAPLLWIGAAVLGLLSLVLTGLEYGTPRSQRAA